MSKDNNDKQIPAITEVWVGDRKFFPVIEHKEKSLLCQDHEQFDHKVVWPTHHTIAAPIEQTPEQTERLKRLVSEAMRETTRKRLEGFFNLDLPTKLEKEDYDRMSRSIVRGLGA